MDTVPVAQAHSSGSTTKVVAYLERGAKFADIENSDEIVDDPENDAYYIGGENPELDEGHQWLRARVSEEDALIFAMDLIVSINERRRLRRGN